MQQHDARERELMVAHQIAGRGVHDQRVLDAMRQVPREAFVPETLNEFAYADTPLPIGEGQTISQPYIVALMIEAAEVKPGDKVLDVGTGSGYAAAVLSRIAGKVFSIERHRPLAEAARRKFARLGYNNIEVRHGDGTLGWPEAAPFDAVICTAAPESIPPKVLGQLKRGGRMVIPVGPQGGNQELLRIIRSPVGEIPRVERLLPVRFVPMTGEARNPG
jgi:protein-L-isoaspartate(D-aspartate) O-methyltransferase